MDYKADLEKKLRTQVQVGLLELQAQIFGSGDLILYSAITGVDGSRKLAEILVEEAEKVKAQLNTEV